jgi:hypothetical protein
MSTLITSPPTSAPAIRDRGADNLRGTDLTPPPRQRTGNPPADT